MHSSGMRTARLLTVSQHTLCVCVCGGGVSQHALGRGCLPRGVSALGGVCPRGMSAQGGICPRGMSAQGVSAQGVSAQGVSALGVSTLSALGGVCPGVCPCPGGVCPGVCGRHPPVNSMTDRQV